MISSLVRRLSNATGSRRDQKRGKESIPPPIKQDNHVVEKAIQHISSVDGVQATVKPTESGRRRYTITSRSIESQQQPNEQQKTTPQQETGQIDDELQTRLTKLKQYRKWTEHKRASSREHQKSQLGPEADVFRHIAGHNQPNLPPRPITGIHDLPLRHDETDIVETSIEAPTPFSTPQVTPVPIKKATGHDNVDASFAASPPGFSLQAAENAHSWTGNRPRTSSRLTITSTPIEVLEQRSRSSSQTRGRSPTPQVAVVRDKKYPPVSYYHNATPTTDNIRTLQPDYRRTTPSISPHSNADVASRQKKAPQPPSTPLDKRGRPVFYSTIHYYTECSHASPPATRPLDPESQPRNDPDFHPTNPAITRSIIPGMCFNCDTSYRREQENRIVDECTEDIARLKNNLAYLVEQLENLDDDSEEDEQFAHDRYAANLMTSCDFEEDEHDLGDLKGSPLPPISDDDLTSEHASVTRPKMTAHERSYQLRIIKQIRQIEAAIDELREDQDAKVKAIWRGYTPRWGPATLGVQRGSQARSGSRDRGFAVGDVIHPAFRTRSVSTSRTLETGLADLCLKTGGRDDLQVVGIHDDASATISTVSLEGSTVASREDLLSRTDTPITHDRSISRGRTTARSRASSRSTSTISHRDVPGSWAPGEGKMRVGWIRKD